MLLSKFHLACLLVRQQTTIMDKISKKKAVKKHKTSKKRRKHDASGDESVDMSEKIFPIAHYMDDREEMMKQVFSVMEREKLNCMLPPILKGMTMSALKDHCLRELRNMSDDEVKKVLCGETLETTAEQTSLPPQVDLDSGESTSSSVEECQNENEDKRTLLDILEQEMQEIAFNTVLKTNVVPSVEGSEDEFPEVVAIIPVDSPSKTKSNVPVICIDSGDEEPPLSASPQKSIPDRGKETNFTMTILTDKVSKEKESVGDHKKQSVNVTPVEDSSLNNQRKGSPVVSLVTSQPQESFLIQVFPKTTSVGGRIVKKVYKSPQKPAEEVILANIDLQSHTNTVECDPEGGESSEVEITHEDIVQSDDSISESELGTKLSNGVCDTSASQVKEPCGEDHSLNASVNCVNEICSEDTIQLQQSEEKEEGEISEEEFEEHVEVLEKARNSQRSPTISLSSDCSGRKSDTERSESRARVRKHRHGHRRNRRETDSPERSRRHIEKRGNRSYRRKTSSSVLKKSDKVEERSEESSGREPSMCCTEMPVVALEDIELPPAKTSPRDVEVKIATSTENKVETSGDLESGKEKNKEDVKVQEDVSHAPDKLNNIPDSKLDSSEDPEVSDSGEPVSSKTSWADRWAEKKDLKKVVITSKICRNVRKKILSARKKQASQETCTVQTPVLPPVPPLVLHVEGSVKEYQMLQLLVSDNIEDEQGSSSTDVMKKVPNEKAFDCHRSKEETGNKTASVSNINEASATLKQVSEEK